MNTLSNITQNMISDKNYRASATLTEGSTWTGVFEPCHSFNSISTVVKTTSVDKIGWLYCDWSRDGTNTVQTFAFRIWDLELNKTITSQVKNAYFRLRFVCSTVQDSRVTNPTSNDMASLEIYTMLHLQPVKGYFEFGRQKVNISGYDNSGTTKIISYNAATNSANYPFPTTGCLVRVVNNCANNGDIVSGAAGIYARQGIVVGLDTSNNEIYWRMSIVSATSGGTTTSPTAIFTRVNDFRITLYGTAGTPELTSTGNIKIQINDTSYKDVTQLHYDYDWRIACCAYSVPANYSSAKISNINYSSNNLGYGIRMIMHKRVPGTLINLRKPEHILWWAYVSPKQVYYPDGYGYGQPGDMYAGVTIASPNVLCNVEGELECG